MRTCAAPAAQTRSFQLENVVETAECPQEEPFQNAKLSDREASQAADACHECPMGVTA
jgi:hypothetical protein